MRRYIIDADVAKLRNLIAAGKAVTEAADIVSKENVVLRTAVQQLAENNAEFSKLLKPAKAAKPAGKAEVDPLK